MSTAESPGEPSRVRLAGDGHHHAVRALEPRGDRVVVTTYCGVVVDIVLTYAAQGGLGPCPECRTEHERTQKWWPGQG